MALQSSVINRPTSKPRGDHRKLDLIWMPKVMRDSSTTSEKAPKRLKRPRISQGRRAGQ